MDQTLNTPFALIALENDRRGAAALEYTLMWALIGIAALSVSGTLESDMSSVFTQIANVLTGGSDLVTVF